MASLQSFSIPGSIFMSFLGGALFGLPVGFCVVTLVRTLPPTTTTTHLFLLRTRPMGKKPVNAEACAPS
jgi:hypothetical protein